jgi:hypothetical protein
MKTVMQKRYLMTAVLVAAIGLMNLARVDRTNPREDRAETIEWQTQTPANVAAIFRRACQNCHSERTEWPWYSAVAPFHWLMTADVYAAREHMNLSTWGRYNEEQRTAALIGICEMAASSKMPPWYYQLAHSPSARLSDGDKKAVCDWVKTEVQRSAFAQTLNSGKGDEQ